MIVHIPHASISIPDVYREQFTLADADLMEELQRSTDWFTDEIFAVPRATHISFPISRLVVDPERFAQDGEEAMARVGRGAIYTSTTEGTRMRRALTNEERRDLLEMYYHPHHEAFTRATHTELRGSGRALIIDAHSFPDVPWKIEPDRTSPRPDFCIGTDSFHTPKHLVEHARALLKSRGYSVAVDTPYAGTIVPLEFYRKEPSVVSIMIEINRRLYMDEHTCTRRPRLAAVGEDVREVCEELERCIR